MAKQAAGSVLVQYRRHHGPRRRHRLAERRATSPSSRSRSSTRRRPTPPARFRAASSSAKGGRPTTRSCPAASSTAPSARSSPKASRTRSRSSCPCISADQENDADVLGVARRLVRAHDLEDPLQGPDRRRARRPRGGQLDPQPDLPAARVLRHGPRRRRLGDSIMMVEGGALEVSEAEMLEALKIAQRGIKELIKLTRSWSRRSAAEDGVGRPGQRTPTSGQGREGGRRAKRSRRRSTRRTRQPRRGRRRREAPRSRRRWPSSSPTRARTSARELEDIEYHALRDQVLDTGERVDGRKTETVRAITVDSRRRCRAPTARRSSRAARRRRSSPPRSAPRDDEQRLDSIEVAGQTTKSFMLHYNFPPFSHR